MKKRIKITYSFIVDEANMNGTKRFHDTISGFLHQLRNDFGGEVFDPQGQVDILKPNDGLTIGQMIAAGRVECWQCFAIRKTDSKGQVEPCPNTCDEFWNLFVEAR